MKEEIKTALRAKIPFLWIPSTEETRTERRIFEVASSFGKIRSETGAEIDGNYAVRIWTVTKGTENLDGEILLDNPDPNESLKLAATKDGGRVITIYKDFGPLLSGNFIAQRAVRDFMKTSAALPISQAKAVIVISPEKPAVEIPGMKIIESPLPKRDDLEKILNSILDSLPDKISNETRKNGNMDDIISAGLGLTADQFSDAISLSAVSKKSIDTKMIYKEKTSVIAQDKILELIETDIKPEDVGGNEELKYWVFQRQKAFGKAAREYGLPIPKGVMIIGVSGCGKSLTSKAMAAAWKMPLLRFDAAAAFGKYVGDSESSFRNALKRAQAIAPCILWIDEIEKAFAQGSEDPVAKRMLGIFLTFMQENTDPIFIAATANKISDLPPEFLGRFDQRFFVDLPSLEERIDIVKIMARKYPKAGNIDANILAQEFDGYSGREIETAFKAALFRAFDDNARPATTKDIQIELKEIVPISKTMKSEIDTLRKWAEGKARFASKKSAEKGAAVRALEI